MPLKLVVDHVVGGQPLPAVVARLLPGGASASRGAMLALAASLALAVSVLQALRWTNQWLLQVVTGERLVLRLRSMLFRHSKPR